MAPTPPPLPTRFPCWVRAVYSWGGESKRDLGFVEGDLIECLNAGDGSWWTGRLWRDRRAIGLFPSNFVEVLPETFRPMTRSTSPLPNKSNTPSPKSTPQKSRTFRKPFEAYAKAPHYTTAKIPETYKDGSVRQRENSATSLKSVHDEPIRNVPTPPKVNGYGSRTASPAQAPSPRYHTPPQQLSPARQSQPPPPPPPSQQLALQQAPLLLQQAPFPQQQLPPQQQQQQPPPQQQQFQQPQFQSPQFQSPKYQSPQYKAYRPSPQQNRHSFEEPDSPPPPAPPPHRHVVTRNDSNASYDNRIPVEHLSRHNSNASYVSYDYQSSGYHTPRAPSPVPPSPGGDGFTPSPLREAMDDVMEQLDALGGGRGETQSPEPPLDPWSPESFDMVHNRSKRKRDQLRPQTSMGIAQHPDEGYDTYSASGGSSRYHNAYQEEQETTAPQLSNYVERMETRLRNMQQQNAASSVTSDGDDAPPSPPPKNHPFDRPKSSMDMHQQQAEPKLRHKKSAYEFGRQMIGRTFTNKTNSTSTSSGTRSTATTSTNSTNSSSATQSTNRSLMSGVSASGISATSAGSLARKNQSRAQSAMGMRDLDPDSNRPETPFTGVTYHSSHATNNNNNDIPRPKSQAGNHPPGNHPAAAAAAEDPLAGLGGLVQPKAKKQNFIKRILESAKTGVASSRNSIAVAGTGSPQSSSVFSRSVGSGGAGGSGGRPLSGIVGGMSMGMGMGMGMGVHGPDAAREMGLGNGVDWVQVRRDVNRSNSLSQNEIIERRERCQMMDHPAIDPTDELYSSIDGDEGADGMPVAAPTDYQAINYSQVDKNSRFVVSLPPLTTAITLATTYVCRPYRSDVQRLRAIFTWVAEKVCWEEDFEGPVDTRRVMQTKRACSEEYAVLVLEMCAAVGLHCEIVRGYLKTPGEIPESGGMMPRSNHWWNAVLVDDEWRMMDCCLASPSNPRRGLYSGAGSGAADPWWFLTRPTELCWTHIPEHHEQQHICPPVAHEILLNLPCACAPFFRHGLAMIDYNTSLTRIEDLEMVHVKLAVPADVELAAEVEVRAYARDADGDIFESGDVLRKRALAQAEWCGGVKRYTVKALLPGDEGVGVLKVYAGKRGLMHSIKDIPHPLALALPVVHTGENPPYEFVTRHPTPHAQRHDIYVIQPQCQRLALNNTFVFAIRQHPSCAPNSNNNGGGNPMTPSSNPGTVSPVPFARPGSALSMSSSAAVSSNPSSSAANGNAAGNTGSSGGAKKPAKLAIQTPGGKILRLMRKEERRGIGVGVGVGVGAGLGDDKAGGDGGTWETIIKCSERGVWRGLVLADRTARWCVFAEWVCVG